MSTKISLFLVLFLGATAIFTASGCSGVKMSTTYFTPQFQESLRAKCNVERMPQSEEEWATLTNNEVGCITFVAAWECGQMKDRGEVCPPIPRQIIQAPGYKNPFEVETKGHKWVQVEVTKKFNEPLPGAYKPLCVGPYANVVVTEGTAKGEHYACRYSWPRGCESLSCIVVETDKCYHTNDECP